MSQKIGQRELQLRAMREAASKPAKPVSKSELKAAVTATLPSTSGKKPVKRKRHK
jgi:hypothetical protein